MEWTLSVHPAEDCDTPQSSLVAATPNTAHKTHLFEAQLECSPATCPASHDKENGTAEVGSSHTVVQRSCKLRAHAVLQLVNTVDAISNWDIALAVSGADHQETK